MERVGSESIAEPPKYQGDPAVAARPAKGFARAGSANESPIVEMSQRLVDPGCGLPDAGIRGEGQSAQENLSRQAQIAQRWRPKGIEWAVMESHGMATINHRAARINGPSQP